MTSSMDTAIVTAHIQKPEDMSIEEYMQLTHSLMIRLKDQDVESVALARDQTTASVGAKGDPLTIGVLVIVVVQVVLPKVIEFLQAWSLRGHGCTIKFEIQTGDVSVKLEYPTTMSPDEVKKHIESVNNELWK